MQKNVLAVVAITGSCAILYILYRCKVFSKNNCIKAKDKNMGKSNCIKLNDDQKNMYGKIIINDSNDLAINKSLLNSLNKSKISQTRSPGKLTNHKIEFEDEIMSTMVSSVEFEEDSTAVLLESNSIFEDSRSYLKLRNLDQGETFDIDNDSEIDIKFIDLDVNKNNREPLEYIHCTLQSEIFNISGSAPLLLSHKTNSLLNCNSNGLSEDPQLNSVCEALLDYCIESHTENMPLNITDSVNDFVPNHEANESEIHETCLEVCKADVSNASLEVLRSDSLNCCDNSCIEINTDCENKKLEDTKSIDIQLAIIPRDKKSIGDEDNYNCIRQCDCNNSANLCNCDNVDKSFEVIKNESQTVPSVRPKTKKPKKRRSKEVETSDLMIETSSIYIESSSAVNLLGNANPISNCDLQVPVVCTKEEYTIDLPTIKQNLEDVNAAWSNAEQPLASSVELENMEEFFAYEFEVPQTLVGRLIGKQGNFINKIKNETNTKMAIVTCEDKKIVPICYIHGTHHQVMEALRKIRERFPLEDFPDLTLTQINSLQLSAPMPISHIPLQIQIPPGICVEVRASCIVSPGELWLQQHAHPSFNKLGDLHRLMNDYYGDGSTTPQFEMPALENSVCVCRLDERWYRCATVSQNYLTVSVRLLDIGNIVTVPIRNLRQMLVPDYTRLELQAANAILYGLMPTDGIRYSEEARAELIHTLSDANLVATVNAYGPNMEPMIKLYIKRIDKYTYVNEELVEKGFAQIAPGMIL